jgi:DNA-binding transcriptional LysR family regulator
MERLDLRLVEHFVAVAEELHFGRAAERLHIAQPSLSQQIRRLETQLGVSLLERNSRNVHLTTAGTAFLHEGRKVLTQAQHAIQTTRAAGAPRLTLGFYGSAASELLPEVLRVFGERLPSVDVCVRELLLGSIDDILDGSVNIAFTRLLPGQTELEVEVLTQESRLAALASTHPLAARESLSFADLGEESFIINPVTKCHRRRSRGRVSRLATRPRLPRRENSDRGITTSRCRQARHSSDERVDRQRVATRRTGDHVKLQERLAAAAAIGYD